MSTTPRLGMEVADAITGDERRARADDNWTPDAADRAAEREERWRWRCLGERP